MALFNVYPLYDITPIKGKDVYVYDDKGNEYLDLYGGHAVISIGHSHPEYVKNISEQVSKLGFYSNAIQNPLQRKLSECLGRLSNCEDYNLFFCNSGAEANENALKLASFETKKSRVLAFKNSFHGRTSAAVATTDNTSIVAPINAQQKVTFLNFGDAESLEKELSKGDVCAIIFETIQGVGGLDEAPTAFYKSIETLCNTYNTLIIADEVQSGYGRSGDFFAFQKHHITPHIISIAKGMGNGFPIGGILIHPSIKAKYGMLGTTFGGNHLACTAGIVVLDIIEKQNLIAQVNTISNYISTLELPKEVKLKKGRGLMLGLEFDFEVAEIRRKLIYDEHIFTGASKNKNLLRLLPPLTIQRKHIDTFINSLNKVLK